VLAFDKEYPGASGGLPVRLYTEARLQVGDYLELQAYHGDSVSRNIIGGRNGTFMAVRRVGP